MKLSARLTTLLLAILCCAIGAAAQGVAFHDFVAGPDGRPVPQPSVTVCAGTSLNLQNCATKATIYADPGLTVPLSNPFHGDNYGNFSFAAAPGVYTILISGQQISFKSYVITLACAPNTSCAAPSLPLSVANGGTGTATPSLTAGLNIGITGTWPNQTIGVTGVIGVANGGTGASSLAGAGISTFTGAITVGDCAKFNATSGQLADAGAACSSGGGVSLSAANTWSATQSFKPASGDAIDILNSGGTTIGKWDSSGNITVATTISPATNNSLTLDAGCSTCDVSIGQYGTDTIIVGGSVFATQQNNMPIEWGLYSTYNGQLVPTTLTANRSYTLPDASGTVCVANAGTSGCGGGVSENTGNQINLGATATGTQLVTLVTPASTTPYRLLVVVGVNTAEAGCTTNASVKAYASWTDAESGTVQTLTGSSAITPGTVITYYGSTTSILAPIVAKTSTAVQAGLQVNTAAAGCTTFPKIDVWAEALP